MTKLLVMILVKLFESVLLFTWKIVFFSSFIVSQKKEETREYLMLYVAQEGHQIFFLLTAFHPFQ